ncbi:MAG TPA: flagellar hook-associated protein FlgK [Solirubrobacteraceae bacterium]|nr:flagellar hook-associated protein FlgK [Solirubrobacteraceae bacterium]
MPISTFMGLQTSLRGLLAEQRALDVTSHNVANANTQGYSRQEAQLQAADALALPTGDRLGTGVDVIAYKRIRDSFLDLQFRAQSMQVGAGTTRADALDQAELRLSEPGDNGIAARLNTFWSSWADLANAPDSGAARQGLIEDSKTLVSAINALDDGLQTVSDQAASELSALTGTGGELHQIARELAGINGAIRDAERVGGQPNDLLDRRDLLLDKLSSLAQVSVSDDGAGSIRVTLGGAATPLVDGSSLNWPAPAMTSPGGKIGALSDLSSPTGTIASYRADLSAFSQALTTQVNAIYQPAAGAAFFAYDTATSMLSLNPEVTAVTVRAGAGAAGDNSAARALSELRGTPGGPDDLYARLVTRIGTEVADARRGTLNATALADSIEDRRQSTAGVSLDEEMTNLIRFQRGYQAAARAMSTTDEMLDVLINRTGRVGL